MRLLTFHVDRFAATVTDKARARLREPRPDAPIVLEDGLLVLANVEAGDEADSEGVAQAAATQLADLARQVKAARALILPFAHLFGEPGEPEVALRILDALTAGLRAQGIEAQRVPFGWFYAWDLRAKGHPLSRVARRITPQPKASAERPSSDAGPSPGEP